MKQLRRSLEIECNLIHIWGSAGSGKTLFAIKQAATASRTGRVEWICTDGKTGFIATLKRNTKASGGQESNIIVTVAQGHADAQKALEEISLRIHPDTTMIVVDTITRVVDMSRGDEVMWGREMIEEMLPILAAKAEQGVKVLLISEVRYLDVGLLPVMYDAIARWNPANLHITRGPGRHSTISVPDAQDEQAIGVLRVDNDGIVYVMPHEELHEIPGGEGRCLGSQSFA